MARQVTAKVFGVSAREVLKKELKVLVDLHFELLMKPQQLLPHCVMLYEKVATDEDTILRSSMRDGQTVFTLGDEL